MTVDFKTLLSILPHVTTANHPVLLRGRHGIGKSSVVYQFADSMGLPVVERRASQMTEGDLLGLPKTDGNVTTFCPPDWLDRACNEAVLLFLDEVDRATLEVRQGIFELCDSRKLAGNVLHPETLIFAAVNGGTHAGAAAYQVGEMDPAELDRYTTFDVEPSVDDWITWAQSSVDTLIIDFIRGEPAHLEHNDDPEPNKVYPSRRSWVRLNETLTAAGLLTAGEVRPEVYSLSAAYIGFEAAVAFNDYVRNVEKVVSVTDVLDKGILPKDFDLNDHCALIDKIAASGRLDDALKAKATENLARYFMDIPSEPAMKLWSAIGAANSDNAIALHGSTVDDKSVGAYLVEILTGEEINKK